MRLASVISPEEPGVGLVVVVVAVAILVVIIGLWMIVKPQQVWRFKFVGQFRDPESVGPSELAEGVIRFAGMTLAFLVLLAGLAMVNGGFDGKRDEDTSADERPRTLCRNWDAEEYEEVKKTAGKEWNSVVPAAYQANRCSVTFGYGAENLREVLKLYVDSGVRPDEDSLQAFYVDYLANDGLLSGWSSLCLQVTERTEDDLADLQQKLGEGLAVATQPGFQRVNDNWDALRKLGNQKIQLRTYAQPKGVEAWEYTKKFEADENGPVVFGWSVLAPLLRFGEFREDFLVPMAASILTFDEKHPRGWTVPGEKWVSFDAKATDPEVEDAVEPVLAALDRNVKAAQKVLEVTGDERVAELLSELTGLCAGQRTRWCAVLVLTAVVVVMESLRELAGDHLEHGVPVGGGDG